MELVKNIFFNTDKLTSFSQIKLSYIGKFFDSNCKKVFIHYGFGENWEHANDIEMIKTELGFQAELELTNDSTFNFCFFNENNEWDNNDGKNYIFNIEETNTDLISLDELALKSNKLSKFYLWKKKAKITIYKAVTYLPNLITGKYKRKNKIQENEFK